MWYLIMKRRKFSGFTKYTLKKKKKDRNSNFFNIILNDRNSLFMRYSVTDFILFFATWVTKSLYLCFPANEWQFKITLFFQLRLEALVKYKYFWFRIFEVIKSFGITSLILLLFQGKFGHLHLIHVQIRYLLCWLPRSGLMWLTHRQFRNMKVRKQLKNWVICLI